MPAEAGQTVPAVVIMPVEHNAGSPVRRVGSSIFRGIVCTGLTAVIIVTAYGCQPYLGAFRTRQEFVGISVDLDPGVVECFGLHFEAEDIFHGCYDKPIVTGSIPCDSAHSTGFISLIAFSDEHLTNASSPITQPSGILIEVNPSQK